MTSSLQPQSILWNKGLWGVKTMKAQRPTFWLPSERLYDRAPATASPTSPWHTQGHLETTPSSSISYEHVAQHPRTVFDRQHVIKLAFDR